MKKLTCISGLAALVTLAATPAAAIGFVPDVEIPEPGTLPALLVGLAVTVWLRRRR